MAGSSVCDYAAQAFCQAVEKRCMENGIAGVAEIGQFLKNIGAISQGETVASNTSAGNNVRDNGVSLS